MRESDIIGHEGDYDSIAYHRFNKILSKVTFDELEEFKHESETYNQAILRAIHYAKYFERR